MRSATKRGLSLLEVLVAAGLALLVLGVAAQLLASTFRASGRQSTRVELQERAAIATDKLVSELRACTAAGVSLLIPAAPGGRCGLSLQPVVDVTSDVPPVPVYEARLHLYHFDPASHRLLRSTWPPTPPTLGWTPQSSRPQRATPSELDSLFTQATAGQIVLANQVQSMEISSSATAPAVGTPVTLRLEMTSGEQTPQRFVLTRTVSLRPSE